MWANILDRKIFFFDEKYSNFFTVNFNRFRLIFGYVVLLTN